MAGQAPGIFNIFPNGLNKGPHILIFFKGLWGPTQIGENLFPRMGPASGGGIRKDGSFVCVIRGFPECPIGGAYHKDYSTLWPILGSPYFGKLSVTCSALLLEA